MTLTAYYDLQCSPPTYDIVAFLLAAERWRVRCGEEKIAISILPGPVNGFRRDRFWPFTAEERTRTLHQIVLPMARMLPSACEVTVRSDRPRAEPGSIGHMCRLYGTRLFVECMRNGIRPLRPPEDTEHDPSLVTITLREAEHWPERNSNIPEWVAAAKEIERRGYRVVIVRDTLHAGDEIEGLQTSKAAAWDLIARAQLYRSAACNIGVSNGPMWFAMALDASVLIIKVSSESSSTSSASYLRRCGLDESCAGWTPPYQKLYWEDDCTDAIVNAFDQYICGEKDGRPSQALCGDDARRNQLSASA